MTIESSSGFVVSASDAARCAASRTPLLVLRRGHAREEQMVVAVRAPSFFLRAHEGAGIGQSGQAASYAIRAISGHLWHLSADLTFEWPG
jgi:hypothetical protein